MLHCVSLQASSSPPCAGEVLGRSSPCTAVKNWEEAQLARFGPALSLEKVLTPSRPEQQAHMCSTPFKWLFQEQRHEALVHTTVTRHAHVSAKQVTGKGKTDSRRAGSQPSPSRPWDIYQKLTFCWLIRKCTGQLSPI